MPFHGIFSLMFLVFMIVCVVVAVRSLFGTGRHSRFGQNRSSALDVLEERYAKGEIQREEYLQKKRDLGG